MYRFQCFGALAGLGAFVRDGFLCVSVLRFRRVPGWGWLAVGCFRPQHPSPGGLLYWPFWGSGPGVGLALCCFVVCSAGRFVVCLAFCCFVLVFCGPFGVVVASLGEERANLGAFRTFVRFVLVWFCQFPLPLGVWEGLRFVIVAFPGLFSYPFFQLI